MKKLLIISLLAASIGCNTEDQNRDEFIFYYTESIKYELMEKNSAVLEKLALRDSSMIVYHDSTLRILKEIEKVKTELKQFNTSNKSKDVVDKILLENGLGEKIQMEVNKYCKFASRPGYKVWNIAKDAMDLSLTTDSELIPFEVYYFENTSISEALTILTLLQIEILHVENGYYLHSLRKK